MASSSSSSKRCLYEVLGLQINCTTDEIRSAYRKLALQRHPDKLMQSGLSEPEATAQFQELVHAYEVLSDPKERAWYDSHRSQILFSDSNCRDSDSVVPNLFSYFSNTVYSGYSNTKKGFYKVYSEVFDKIYVNEVNYCKKLGLGSHLVKEAPIMGDLESPYGQVTAFYNYWLGFSTVMDFAWVDEYNAMAGINRKSRRVMEEENKKLRKKAKREFNETVRGLAEFVKKRDKRVIDMAVKKKEELERKKEEEKERRRRAERERLGRLSTFEEPEWAKIAVDDDDDDDDEIFEEEEKKKHEGKELYCVACGKKFKSEKQWKNHEQSKKHKEKVAELRQSFVDEDEEREEDFEEFQDGKADEELGSDDLEELGERLKEGLGSKKEKGENVVSGLRGDDGDAFVDTEKGDSGKTGDDGEDKDDEMSVLEAMVSGRKSRRKNAGLRHFDEHLVREFYIEDESEDEVMQYNNRKSTRKTRGGKKEKWKENRGGDMKGEVDENKQYQNKENKEQDNSQVEGSTLHSHVENESDDQLGENGKSSNHPFDKKGNTKKDSNAKSNNSSKGKKTKHSSNLCETCGEEFKSRNKLHKHLGETGHATLKFR